MLQYDDVMKLDFGTQIDGNILEVIINSAVAMLLLELFFYN